MRLLLAALSMGFFSAFVVCTRVFSSLVPHKNSFKDELLWKEGSLTTYWSHNETRCLLCLIVAASLDETKVPEKPVRLASSQGFVA